MTGPCVMSKAPPVASASSCDAAQHREQVLADRHRATDGRLGDPIQLAVRPVVREDVVEVADAIEGGAECGLRRLLVRRVERDPDERAHVRLDRFVAVQLRRSPQRGQQRRSRGSQRRSSPSATDVTVQYGSSSTPLFQARYISSARRQLRGTDQAEAEPLGVGHVPDALGQLRILLLPRGVGGTRAVQLTLRCVVVPRAAAHGMRIRRGGLDPRILRRRGVYGAY